MVLDQPTDRHTHFIGIGGKGMSALAQVMVEMGTQVTGSDLKESSLTRRLEAKGARVYIGHNPDYVKPADVVIYSTGIPDDNPELVEAQRLNKEVLHRSELLGLLLNRNRGIAVAGAHGKTTTTGMLGVLLTRGGLDPTVLIGEEIAAFNSNARLGQSQFVVAEADESDRSFLRYHPEIAVITNIEADHLEYYSGSLKNLVDSYRQFLAGTAEGGLAVLCTDDDRVRELADQREGPTTTYGLERRADVTAQEIELTGRGANYELVAGGEAKGRIRLSVPGVHNVYNSLAACAVGFALDLDPECMRDALNDFRGARRRFELVAERDGVLVVDDYAHHPTEIKATLAAARSGTQRRIVAVFQPQRYTRTKFLMDDFARAFSDADLLVITDIYSPQGETPIPGVSAAALAERVAEYEEIDVVYLSEPEQIKNFLLTVAESGDLILTMGAGDIWKVAHSLGEELSD